MIVLYLLIILAAIALWFLLAFVFVPLGKFLYRIWRDAMDEMSRDGNEKENDEE